MRKSLMLVIMCGLMAIGSSIPAQTKGQGFAVTRIGDGVYAALGEDGGPAGSNAGFIVGNNGVAVIDTFQGVAPAKDLLAEIRKITSLPIRYVVNTHYHLDHVGGNAVFADAGALIIAQRNVFGWERTENLKFFGTDPKPERRAFVEALVLPDVTYTDAIDLRLGDRLIEVRYMLGHTGGDSVVTVPGAKDKTADIVFGGDLIWQKHLPNLIDASTAPWVETLDKLLAGHPNSVFVSGHGGIATPADVTDFRNYLATLRKSVAKSQTSGLADDALVAAVTAELKDTYAKWGFFDHFIKPNITLTAAELKGSKKVPVPAKN